MACSLSFFLVINVPFIQVFKDISWCGLHKVQLKDSNEIELAYILDKNYWGKGLATEAAIAVKKYAFDILNLPYIVSCIDSKNISSINVAKKNGMEYWRDSAFFGKPCQVYKVESHTYLSGSAKSSSS